MNKSRFYTTTGDDGNTVRLGEAVRLSKDSPLLEAVGATDEATSAIGMARALVEDAALQATLRTVQEHLVRLMAHLAATPEFRDRYPAPGVDDLTWLEACIAALEAGLPALKAFVLPGDSLPGAALHVARTAVRRAERRVVALAAVEPGIDSLCLAYLNRLSSLLFVAALHVDASLPKSDVTV
ncbi:MAG TPA: cob(I)yrinic acid a,c-diamide adenosyltransferase [Anaerolineae bacterium]|nr:cob(I)yrinic acid a,c-diamide adenosyltransferase [Anaerolineae bacterium]HQH39576.1 cob(I)yrinic acid a,c-diamide adenosyltransferase [Anaerolineae bacterium]